MCSLFTAYLSVITDTDIDVVRTAMKIFRVLGLVNILDNGTIYMEQMNGLIGSETKWAEKKRLSRKKEDNVPTLSPECPNDVVDVSKDCPIDVRQEKETDKDIDKDKEQQQHKITEVKRHVNTQNKKKLKTDVVGDSLKNIANEFTRLLNRTPNSNDVTNMDSISENQIAKNIDNKTREKLIIQTMERIVKDFKISNPGSRINSFKYFATPVIEEFNKYLKTKGGVKNEQSSTIITDKHGHTIDFSKISVHRSV